MTIEQPVVFVVVVSLCGEGPTCAVFADLDKARAYAVETLNYDYYDDDEGVWYDAVEDVTIQANGWSYVIDGVGVATIRAEKVRQ